MGFSGAFGFHNGNAGGGGGGGDKNFVFTQVVASDTWVVNHFLNKYCSVDVTDIYQKLIQAEVNWVNLNTVIIKFNIPVAGNCYCN